MRDRHSFLHRSDLSVLLFETTFLYGLSVFTVHITELSGEVWAIDGLAMFSLTAAWRVRHLHLMREHVSILVILSHHGHFSDILRDLGGFDWTVTERHSLILSCRLLASE